MPEDSRKTKPLLVTIAGSALLVGALAWSFAVERADQADSQTAEPPAAATAPMGAPLAPSFDIVRIGAEGNAVIAGRGMARAEVVLHDHGREIGRVIGDDRGEWVFVPDQALPPGPHVLTLSAVNPDGSKAESAAPVILVVGPDGHGMAAVKLPAADAGLVLLQGDAARNGALSILAARNAEGALTVTGSAVPGQSVRLLLGERVLGTAAADAHGHWRVAARMGLPAGIHRLQVQAGSQRVEATLALRGEAPSEAAEIEENDQGWTVRRPGSRSPDTTAIFAKPVR